MRVAAPSETLPLPARDPAVSEYPAKFQVVPEFTVTALASGITFVAPKVKVPPEILTAPTKVLVPERVIVPLPCLVNAPVPDMTPE